MITKILEWKRTKLWHLLRFKCKLRCCGSITNRCEICIIIVKIKPIHAHLNHLAEKCQVHVPKMILSS